MSVITHVAYYSMDFPLLVVLSLCLRILYSSISIIISGGGAEKVNLTLAEKLELIRKLGSGASVK